jgi:tRNA pseudouridine38-40 synthase
LHMVRNIAGSLYQIGSGRQPVDWLAHLLAARNRTIAAATAPPQGLYMVHVEYPDRYDFPDTQLPIVLHNVEI